jgi:hypothetical protein
MVINRVSATRSQKDRDTILGQIPLEEAISRQYLCESQKDRDTILGQIHRLTDSPNKNSFTNITVA